MSTAAPSTTLSTTTQAIQQIFNVNNQEVIDPRTRFYDLANKIVQGKDSIVKCKIKYDEIIADLRSAKGLAKKARTMQQEYLYRRYEIYVVAEYSRLIKKVQAAALDSRPKIYIYLEEIFDLIEKEHIRSDDYLSRMQIDLIDLQSFPDGRFKWILTIQDHFTKFVFLRALEQKKAAEVAMHLFDVFLQFGAPAILQSDNGKEFRAKVVEELKVYLF